MLDMLREANVTVRIATQIDAVRRLPTARAAAGGAAAPPHIASVSTPDGRVLEASVFVDGTYEGALVKLAGVSYTFGREANTTYGEAAAGRLPTLTEEPVWPTGDRAAQLPQGISPWVDATNTTLLKGVWGGFVAPAGAADDRVGGYDWRLTLTDDRANWIQIPQPEIYDPADYELVRRVLKKKPGLAHTPGFSVPNRKTDWKMFGTFGEFPNKQWDYPNASYARQQEIVEGFKQGALGLLKFFTTDPAVPAAVRQKMSTYGLCRDEYNRSDHWMSQLYVRTALRMVGRRVLTEQDVVLHEFPGDIADSIGVGAYTVDIPGPVQTIVDPISGAVVNEGALKVPNYCVATVAFPSGISPFPLPYAAMLPKRGEVDNLIVPVALSASHVAFNSIRMEPTWMTLGQSAGVAAAIAAKGGISVGDVDVPKLQDRLRALGQLLAPLPPVPPPPPPPPALTGKEWYAYRKMWQLVGSGTDDSAAVIVATEDGSVLKRSFKHSTPLPPCTGTGSTCAVHCRMPQPCPDEPSHAYCPSDPSKGQCQMPPVKACPPCSPSPVRDYAKGQRVALTAPPTVARGESAYWLVEVVSEMPNGQDSADEARSPLKTTDEDIAEMNWPTFLSRSDPINSFSVSQPATVPDEWLDASFVGNGMIGTQLLVCPGGICTQSLLLGSNTSLPPLGTPHQVVLPLARADVTDVRTGNVSAACTEWHGTTSCFNMPAHFAQARLGIGALILRPASGTIIGGSIRTHLHNATISATIRTTQGEIEFSVFVHATRQLVVVQALRGSGGEQLTKLQFDFVPAPALSPVMFEEHKGANGSFSRFSGGPLPGRYTPNPAVVCTSSSCHQSLLVLKGRGWVTAWRRSDSGGAGRLMLTICSDIPVRIGVAPKVTRAAEEATAVLTAAAALDSASLAAEHAEWWSDYYFSSHSGAFVSLPAVAAKFEQFHWIQMLKVGSENACRRFVDSAFPSGVLDNCLLLDGLNFVGPMQKTKYPFAIWDMNVEGSQWGSLASNMIEQGLALTRRVPEQLPNLIASVPRELRSDSAAIQVETASLSYLAECMVQHCDADAFPLCLSNASAVQDLPDELCLTQSKAKMPENFFGGLPWVCHNIWLVYRHTMDATILQALVPLLKRATNLYIRTARMDATDGKLHLPTMESPEYGECPDTSFDHALFRWCLRTLIRTSTLLPGSSTDAEVTRWRQTLGALSSPHIDPNTGSLMIGANVSLHSQNKHFSHLFSIFPLGLLEWSVPAERELWTNSLQVFAHFNDPTVSDEGFTYLGMAIITMWAQPALPGGAPATWADAALRNITRHFFGLPQLGAGTMYADHAACGPVAGCREGMAGPCNESPILSSLALQQMLLQSWNGRPIAVFPAVPASWADARFARMRAEGAVLVSAVRANFSTIFISLNATVGGNVSVHSTIVDLVSSNTKVTITPSAAGGKGSGLYDIVSVPRGSGSQQPWAAVLYSKARGPPSAKELELALTPLPAGPPGDLNMWGSRPAGPAPPQPPPGPLGPLLPCAATGCVGCGGCKWPYVNVTLPEPKSPVMGSLLNATALACEAKCETMTGRCVGFTRKEVEKECFFYSKTQVSGVFSHGRPDVSWHPRPPVGAIPPPHKSDDEISADSTSCTLSSEASCKTKLSRNAMLREIKSAGGAASTGADAAGKSVLVRGCDPRMAAKAAGFLPALVGDPEVWESSTDDDDFLAKLDSRAWSVVMFAPGACRYNAANAPIPGANARTQGWSLKQYRALVREVQPETTIVETTEEREIVPKLRAALGLKSDDAEGRRRLKNDDESRLGHSSLRSHSDLVWPKPQQMEQARCGGADASATRVELHGPVSFDGLAALHDLFVRYISASQPGSSLLFRHGSPSSGSAGTDGTTIYAGMHGDVRPVPVALGINESYALAIRANIYGAAINIQAATQVGVLYALESLSQLISFDPETSTYSAPCIDIEDFPRFPHRELMLDSGHFFLPIPLLKQPAVDAMAMTKLNVLHLHAVDSESFPLVIKSRPDFAQLAFSPEERYTLPELAEFANFSAARGVRLVVEVDLPGHMGYPNDVSPGWCLPYPETCPTPRCKSNNDLNPAVNLTYESIEDIITELAEAFGDEMDFIHLGGDEVLQDMSPPNTCWQTDPSISKWINASFPGMYETKKLDQPPDPRGHGGPLAYMNDRIEAIAKKHGRRSIRWEEAFFYSCCDSPTRADPCPGCFVDGCKTSKETIVHHWRAGNSWSGELVKLTSAHGYSSITSAGWYLPGNASKFYAIEPCTGVSEAACAEYVLGGGPALWQRDPSTLISTAFPNAAVVAEVLWSAAPAAGATRDFAEAEPRIRQFRCALADRGVAAAPVDGPHSFGGCRGNQRALPAKTDDEVWKCDATVGSSLEESLHRNCLRTEQVVAMDLIGYYFYSGLGLERGGVDFLGFELSASEMALLDTFDRVDSAWKVPIKTDEDQYTASCDNHGVCGPAGAKADGVTDDTSAVQAALDALETGQTLLFPPGVFLVRNLTIPDRSVTLRGSSRGSTTLKLLNGSTGGYVLATGNWVGPNQPFTGLPLSVIDLILSGPADRVANGTVGLILMAWSSRVADCSFLGFQTGLRVTTTTSAGTPITTSMVNNRYERCEFLQNMGNGFHIHDPSRHTATDYFLTDSFAMYNGGSGFRLDTTGGGLVRGNHLYSNTDADISINIATSTLRVVENYMEDPRSLEIQTFIPHESALVSANIFEGSLVAIANDGNATLLSSNNVFRTQSAVMSLSGNREHWLTVISTGDTFVSTSAPHYEVHGGVRVSVPQMQFVVPAAALKNDDDSPTELTKIWPLPAQLHTMQGGSPSVLCAAVVIVQKIVPRDKVVASAVSRYFAILRNLTTTSSTDTVGVTSVEVEVDPSTDSAVLDIHTNYSYTLKLVPGGSTVQLQAASRFAVAHGLETLAQLYSKTNHGFSGFDVVDSPTFAVRALMLDAGRRFVPLPTLFELVDGMAYSKMSVLNLHASEYGFFRIEIKAFPELTSALGSAFYTQENITQLVSYAHLRGVRVVPQIDVPGHSSGLLPLKSHGLRFCGAPGPPPPPGTAETQLYDDPAGQTLAIIQKIYDELFDIFPDKVFDIGADETHARGNCTLANLAAFEEKLMKHIVEHGKRRPLGWEQVYKVTGASQQTPSSIVRIYDTGTDSAGSDGSMLPMLLNVTSAGQDAIVADSERYYLNSCCPALHGHKLCVLGGTDADRQGGNNSNLHHEDCFYTDINAFDMGTHILTAKQRSHLLGASVHILLAFPFPTCLLAFPPRWEHQYVDGRILRQQRVRCLARPSAHGWLDGRFAYPRRRLPRFAARVDLPGRECLGRRLLPIQADGAGGTQRAVASL
jgi:N-acetyl-beta-hexosaminidase